MGAILAGAGQQDLEVISQYAIPCGIAFQIQDDILGMFGDEKQTGKSVGSDLRQGKQTLLIALALQNAAGPERKKIQGALGDKTLSEKGVNEMREILRESGALAKCGELAQELIGRAKKALQQFLDRGWNQDSIEKLESVADFIVTRQV